MLNFKKALKYLNLASQDILRIICEELIELLKVLLLSFEDIIAIFRTTFSNIIDSLVVSHELLKEEVNEINDNINESIHDIVDKLEL